MVSNLSISPGIRSFQWVDLQSYSDGCLQEIRSPVQCCSLQVLGQGGWESRTGQEQESPKVSKLQKAFFCKNLFGATGVYEVNRICCFESHLFALPDLIVLPIPPFFGILPPSISLLPRALGKLPFQPMRCFWDVLVGDDGVPRLSASVTHEFLPLRVL